MQELQSSWEAEDWPVALQRLRHLALGATDHRTMASLGRWAKRLAEHDNPAERPEVRVALLGNATTTFLTPHLELLLSAHGFNPVIHEAGYDTAAWECLHPDSDTASFAPQVAVVVQSPLAVKDWPPITTIREEAQAWVQDYVDQWLALFEAANANMGCDIIVDTLHSLPLRPHGHLAPRLPGDRNTLIRAVNRDFADRAPEYVFLHDVEAIAANKGVGHWTDERMWFQAKQPMSFESMVPYVQSLARHIASMFRESAKCLVLDLDNTLWGGVVGDDGVAGLALGPGNPVGEAFSAFQDYVAQLKARGVILAVCSKNEDANARAPFKELSTMSLTLEDLASFKANWDPKPDNIRAIAEELNIGLDAMVFVDDNPAERSLVEQTLPIVRVLHLSDDPADYPGMLDRTGWFDTPRISTEDASRTQQYQDNTQREHLREQHTDYEGYLRSLRQEAVIHPFEELHIDRITQLVNKTNQFNLTTQRQNRSEVEDRMHSDDYLTAYVQLADRFGDNGLISVWYGRCDGTRLIIEQWLMSCRVFNRGVEHLLMNYIAVQGGRRGITEIHGTYIPTPKNGLVANLYPSLGFQCANEDITGTTEWVLALDRYEPRNVFIETSNEYQP